MQRIVFVDLDDTLFQTSRKNPSANMLAAVDKEGNPLSFRCGRQAAFLDWLTNDAMVVPVTGRNIDAFRRVVLPLGNRAICSFGGVILDPDGELNPEWHRRILEVAEGNTKPMDDLLEVVASAISELAIDARYRVIHDAGMPLYLSVKNNISSTRELAYLATMVSPLVPEGWALHLNGNNMAILPPFLSKAKAVAFFLEKVVGNKPILTVGVGDSLSDVGFMGLCDYAIAPTRSQILSVLSSQTSFTSGNAE